MMQRLSAYALAATCLALSAHRSTAHPLDYSSPYAASSRLLERATNSSLRPCLEISGVDLSFQGSASYANLSATENSLYSSSADVFALPLNATQVAAVIQCVAATDGQSKVTAKSGGHGYAAYSSDGNVVLDLSNMTDITIDDEAQTVTVGAGMTLGPLAKAIGAKGYALPHGTCPTVGVGGHSLGGGWGYSSRKWGWLMDHVTSIEYVDANSTIKNIDQTSTGADADVWWGMRGAGSNNFGVVTHFTFAMETAPPLTVNFASVYNSNADCANVLLALQELGLKQETDGGLPMEMGGEILMYGENSGNDGACSFSGQYLGSKVDFKAAKKIFNDNLSNMGVVAKSATATEFDDWVDALTNLMGDLDQPKVYEPYYAQSIMDDGTPGYTPTSAQAIVDSVQAAVGVEGSGNSISFDLNGPNSATNLASTTGNMSFVHRHSLFFSQIYSYAFPGFDNATAQQDALSKLDAVTNAVRNAKPDSNDWTAYQNYVDPNLANFGSAYYGSALDRLKSIKETADPNTIFDFPQGLAHA
ncbi:hypothetical protein CBS101457_005707 [Exobasidium rhododendri]|nr:hypothetical protein CBS101457_005707 [Exobasidium rhododendri]